MMSQLQTIKSFVVLYIIVGVNMVFVASSQQATHQGTVEDSTKTASYFFYQRSEYPKDCQHVQMHCSSPISSGAYVIKPAGFREPFEVYCSHDVDQGTWTVIQRREIGHFPFVNRTWSQFKDGFGFLSSDYWIGNDKLSYLTNQAVYQLRIDVEMLNGASFYSTYDTFRITDEFGEYRLTQIGSFESNGSSSLSSCPTNTRYGTCDCQVTCKKPTQRSPCHGNCSGSEGCVCIGGFLMDDNDCVEPSDCSCFLRDVNLVIPDGEIYVTENCTRRCSCTDQQLHCEDDFTCSVNAACIFRNGTRHCICNEGYEGDGEICEAPFADCQDVYEANHRQNGVYTILPFSWTEEPFSVYCEIGSEGGWTVIQSRVDDTTSFYQNWTMYRNGFGDLDRNFWLGNEKLYYLTSQKDYKLRYQITTSSGSSLQGDFAEFEIESEDQYYRMNKLGTRTGNAGCDLSYNKGKKFSTHDRDNDDCETHNCAEKHRSGWWHWDNCVHCYKYRCDHFHVGGSCNSECTNENPNGDYNGGNGECLFSCGSLYCNLRSVKMKIIPLPSQRQ